MALLDTNSKRMFAGDKDSSKEAAKEREATKKKEIKRDENKSVRVGATKTTIIKARALGAGELQVG